ncbi:MAG: sulfotransferase [Gammaproteobacteria bacterium]|nr:sulfotransferase [Gammaproteobacteria bacterium]
MSTHDLKTAIRLHRNGRLQAAHEAYSKLIAARPEDARLRSLFGQLELQMGKVDTAIGHLREAARLAPEDKRIALTLARGLATTRQHDEALSIVHQLLADDDALAEAWSTLAAVHRHRSDHANELVALERATELSPEDIPALIARANAEVANDFSDRAVETLLGASRQAPKNPRIANNLGALYLRRHNLGAAAAELRRALEISPDYAIALSNLAVVLHRMGNLDAAREMAERALKVTPGDIDARSELASILMAQGDLAGAESGFKTALKQAPAHQGVLAGLAELRDRQGRAAEGLQLITDIIASDHASPDIRLVGATLAKRIGRRETALEMLAPLLDSHGDPLYAIDRATRRRLCFLLGEINDAGGDYGSAMHYYDAANTILRPEYDIDKLYARVDAIVDSFDTGPRDSAVNRSPRRIFLVGMPRSGTSLLETMLSRHPAIHACGELPLIARLVNARGDFPKGFPELDDTDLDRMADSYCAATSAPADIRFMTDKMPLNFFYVGAIAKMMPDAFIIHCRRHPADTLLSCYFQNFLDPALAFSYDLETASHYWRNYNRLMTHWQQYLDSRNLEAQHSRIFEVQYEELVASPEAVARPLIERLELDWNYDVLSPHLAGRYISTASHAQIREPIHSRSVGRFARYRPFLGDRAELLDTLE